MAKVRILSPREFLNEITKEKIALDLFLLRETIVIHDRYFGAHKRLERMRTLDIRLRQRLSLAGWILSPLNARRALIIRARATELAQKIEKRLPMLRERVAELPKSQAEGTRRSAELAEKIEALELT